MTGSVTARIIGFALTPIISRLFTPSDFGIFGSFVAVSSIIAAGVTLEYSAAIMLPPKKENAMNLLAFSFFCTFAITFLCLMFCIFTPAAVNGAMNTDGIWPLGLLVLATFAAGVSKSCQAWSVRVKAFKHTSASEVIRSITSNGAKIGFGFLKGGFAGLIISNILANVLVSINLFRVLLPDLLSLRGHIRWDVMKRLAKDYRDFPMYSASQNVINAVAVGLPVLSLTHFYGKEVAGAYAFTMSTLNVPMSFILTALRQVLFQKASESQHQKASLANLYVKTTAGLFVMVLFPSLILFMWAPQLFSWVFGSQWHMAGEIARNLVPWFAVLFAKIIRIQRFVFFFDIVLLSLISVVLLLGGIFLSALQTIMLFALVSSILNTIFIFKVGHVVMKKEGPANWRHFRDILIK